MISEIPKTYSLLSIGQRGAGKTVFLAGSYTELDSAHPSDSQAVWIDCRDSQTEENMEALLNYIVRSGSYPPPTVKITNFNFSLKRYVQSYERTLCHFRWWDLPGESCSFDDPQFRQLVFDSNGCCVFIDADALVHQSSYHQKLQEIRQQIIPILTLVHLNQLNYSFAFLLTKCDLLNTHTEIDRLQEHLHPLTSELDILEIDYRTFYLKVPIVTVAGQSTLQAQGTAEPLLWLVDALETTYRGSSAKVDQPQEVVAGSLQRLVKSSPAVASQRQEVKRSVPADKSANVPKAKTGRNFWALILAIAGFVGIGFGWWLYTTLTPGPSERPVLEQ